MSTWALPLQGVTATASHGVDPTVSGAALSIVFIGILIGKEATAVYPNVDDRVAEVLNAALLPALLGFLAVIFLQASEII